MAQIDLKGLNKAAVLAALYNASKPQGRGFMHYDPTPMTVEQAEELLNQGTYFDYLMGRVMKVDLGGDSLDTWGYDRDNGEGAAQRAIVSLQATSDPDSAEIRHTHSVNTVRSAQRVQSKPAKKASSSMETVSLP
ncbi:hypothetical protein HY502_03135 [Candidatus Woesebacteria bacterium]|nr:hypothetical protein [Candidatus Woesebacteria bacterium]